MYAGSHDKDTLMAASIAELLFPAGQHQAEGESYQAYVARIKTLYHKQVLVPLRKCLDVPEVSRSPCFLLHAPSHAVPCSAFSLFLVTVWYAQLCCIQHPACAYYDALVLSIKLYLDNANICRQQS